VSKKTAKINERDPMVAELWRFLDQDVPVPLNGPGWAKVMRADIPINKVERILKETMV
jgi:hypothetical protein